MKKRLLAVVICLTIALEAVSVMVPQEVFAGTKRVSGTPIKDPTGKYYTNFTIDSYDYYDVGGGASRSIDKSYIYKIVKDKLLPDWANIAEGIFVNEDKYTFLYSNFQDYGETSYQKTFVGTNKKGGRNCYRDVKAGLMGDNGHDGDRSHDYFGRTGLCTASSLDQVRERVARELYYGVNMRSCKQRYFLDWTYKGKINALPELHNTDETYAVYSIVTPIRNRRLSNTYYSYGICFYDFKLTPISASGLEYITAASDYDNSIEKAYEQGAPGISIDNSGCNFSTVSDQRNTSAIPSTFQVSTGNTVTYQTETSFSKTTGVKYTNSVGVKLGIEGDIGTAKAKTEIDYSFTVENSESATEGSRKIKTDTINNTVTSSLSLPAHTAVSVKTTTGERIMDMDFDTPVELSYKVAIFSTCGDMYADDAASCYFTTACYEQKYFLAMFGVGEASNDGSASRDLAIRINPQSGGVIEYPESSNPSGYGFVHRYKNQHASSDETYNYTNANGDSGINWAEIMADEGYKQSILNQRKIPMISSGGTTHMSIRGTTEEVGAVVPLYCLNKVELADKEDKVRTVGLSKSLNVTDSIALKGVDMDGIPYYGFDAEDGEWYLCNYAGYEIDEKNDPGIISIYKDYYGDSYIEGKQAGEAYIRWRLKDGIEYKGEAEPGKSTTKYSDITTPVIKIVVDKYNGGITVHNRSAKILREEIKNAEITVNPISVMGAQGELSYKRLSGDNELRLNTATGEVIVAEDTKPGKYTMKVKVTDLGTNKSVRAEEETEVTVIVSKNEQQLEVSDEVIIIDYNKTQQGNVTTDPIEIFGDKGSKRFVKKSQTSANSKLRVDETTGRITALQGILPGDYDLVVGIDVSGNDEYNSGSITRTIPITVIDLNKINGHGTK